MPAADPFLATKWQQLKRIPRHRGVPNVIQNPRISGVFDLLVALQLTLNSPSHGGNAGPNPAGVTSTKPLVIRGFCYSCRRGSKARNRFLATNWLQTPQTSRRAEVDPMLQGRAAQAITPATRRGRGPP
jgi:hypothetical protein